MRKTVVIISFVVLCALAFVSKASAETVMISNVPYINQVQDMNQTYFLGYNACGPTSAVMITEFHKLQPANTSGYPGWYVYNPYTTWTDKSGEDYNSEAAMDWDGGSNHINLVYGAHGFIVDPDGSDWKANDEKLEGYIDNHGLITSSAIF